MCVTRISASRCFGRLGKEERYVVCVSSDSRNANKTLSWYAKTASDFSMQAISINSIDATKEQCGNAAYKPFPELEKLCQAQEMSLSGE